jgi:hypothetical protein
LCGLRDALDDFTPCPGCQQEDAAAAAEYTRQRRADRELAEALDLPRPPRVLNRRERGAALVGFLDLPETARKHPEWAAEVRSVLELLEGGE